MEFRVLGPLEIVDGEAEVVISAAKQRALLAILLLHTGSTVPGHRLIENLWEQPPVSARKVVQTYISKVRQVLPDGMLLTRPSGYTLCLGPDDLDAVRFERLLADARRARPEEEADLLRQALGLWRGRALEDFADEPFAQPDIVRLENLRLGALTRRCELDLAAGRHLLVLGGLEALVQEHSTDERLRGQLMLAYYRSGRPAEALRVYRDGRRALVEQLGMEPSEPLRRLERAILRHEPSLDVAESAGLPDASRAVSAPSVSSPRDRVPPLRATRPSVDTFVGRTRELERLRPLLLDTATRLVTLTGPAGTGKTRLAAELARQVAPEYPDGAVSVDLTRVSEPGLIASAACAAFGLRPGHLGDAATDLAEFLSSRVQLLVLDNFEHLLPAAPLLEQLLARAPRLTVLATSRAPLDVEAERVVVVPPLPVPARGSPPDVVAAADAVVLFVDRARSARPGFELTEPSADTVGELCARLDGLPLAIELAAARVDLLSPRAILSRLNGRLDLLATAVTSRPERHRSLRAAVDWSYDLLDERQQTVFCELSVFAGGFTVGTAEAVVSPGNGLLVDVVRSLLRASLLRAAGSPGDEPRFGMLETIRDCARAQLDGRGRRHQVRDAHAKAFRTLADQAELQLRGPDQVRWLDLVEAELPNIREALQWSTTDGDVDTGLRTAASLWRFWQVRGRTDEARRHLEAMLASPSGSTEARAAGQLTVARCAFHQGDLAAVREHVAACLPVHRRCGDTYSAAFGLMLVGASTGRSGDVDRGTALLREALELARAARDSWLEASCRGYLGMVSSAQGHYVVARHLLEDGLRGGRELGDTRLVGWFLIGLGRIALAAGDSVRARRRFEEAMTWQRRLVDAWGEAWALQGLACAAILDGAPGSAVELVIQSLTPARRAQSRPAIACALRLLATVALSGGRRELAAQLMGGASLVSPGTPPFWSVEGDGLGGVTADALRVAMGAERFDEHWARGRATTMEDIVAAATRELAVPRSGP